GEAQLVSGERGITVGVEHGLAGDEAPAARAAAGAVLVEPAHLKRRITRGRCGAPLTGCGRAVVARLGFTQLGAAAGAAPHLFDRGLDDEAAGVDRVKMLDEPLVAATVEKALVNLLFHQPVAGDKLRAVVVVIGEVLADTALAD